MSHSVLFPTRGELEVLSQDVGGLVVATYSFPAKDLDGTRKMAVQIASGQTLGYVPDNVETYVHYIGRVQSVECQTNLGRAEIAFPRLLFGSDVAGLLTVLFGKISFAPGLRLESVKGDGLFLSSILGPKFGLEGIRRLSRQDDPRRPLLMAILKPGLGPSDDPIAEQFGRLVQSGTNLVKDDETRIDLSLDESLRRLEKVLGAGKGQGMYVMHLTGPAFDLRSRALQLQQAGAQAFLFCPFTYGLGLLQALCNDPEIKVPIFAHPAFTGVMGSGPSSVAAEVVLGTLMRWCGCDAVLYPSPYGSIALPRTEAQAVHQTLIRQEGALKASASVPSAGIMPEFVGKIREDFGTDVVINAGTGMARTGSGVEDGARAFLKEIAQHYV